MQHGSAFRALFDNEEYAAFGGVGDSDYVMVIVTAMVLLVVIVMGHITVMDGC